MNAQSLAKQRAIQFAENWEAWVCLHHFLPADLMRELVTVLIPAISDGTLVFDDIFEDKLIGSPSEVTAWILHPKATASECATRIQSQIRAFAWRNDAHIPSLPIESQSCGMRAFDAAIQVGRLDFNFDFKLVERAEGSSQQVSFKVICQALMKLMSLCSDERANSAAVVCSATQKELPFPLNAIFRKHCADLLIDDDQFFAARSLYGGVLDSLHDIEPFWQPLAKNLKEILTQSLAATSYAIDGPKAANELLVANLSEQSINSAPAAVLNGSHDALAVGFKANPPVFADDLRPAWMEPPLLLNSHSISSALEFDIEGNGDHAHRSYWAALRRQIALGSLTQRKNTQKHYAVSLFRIDAELQSFELFAMAARLLLESGDSKIVSKIHWSEFTVTRYVDLDLVNILTTKQGKYAGSRVERGLVLIALFNQWIMKIDLSGIAEVKAMLSWIVHMAASAQSSLYAWVDVLTPCIKTLKQVGLQRPEFVHYVVVQIGDLVESAINDAKVENWKGLSSVLELAKIYFSHFTTEVRNIILGKVASLLSDGDIVNVWMVVDPALALLYSPESYTACAEDPKLGRRIVDAVVKIGIEQEREQAQFLANLQYFPPELLSEDAIKLRLKHVIDSVLQGAGSSSALAVGKIQAILLVPDLVDIQILIQVVDALHNLIAAVIPSPRRNFKVDAFYAVRALAHQVTDKKLPLDEGLRNSCANLFALLDDLWRVVREEPHLMSPFSFPQKRKADDAVVHNWALATLELGHALDKEADAMAILQPCYEIKQLEHGTKLACGTLLAGRSADGPVQVDLDQILSSTKDVFYAGLGRYLLLLTNSEYSKRRELIEVILRMTLKFGPKDVDMAILLASVQDGVPVATEGALFDNYSARALSDPGFRTLFQPILAQLSRSQ